MHPDLNPALGPRQLIVAHATAEDAFRSVPYARISSDRALPPAERGSTARDVASVDSSVMAAYFRHFLAEHLVRIAR